MSLSRPRPYTALLSCRRAEPLRSLTAPSACFIPSTFLSPASSIVAVAYRRHSQQLATGRGPPISPTACAAAASECRAPSRSL